MTPAATRKATAPAASAPERHRLSIRKDRPAPTPRSVERRDMTGKALGEVQLPPEVFGIEPNEAVLHQVITAQLAAARAGTQSTKTRSEVRGGGSKPWRQKGTGRARQGSSRSPLWTGGGVALGPKPRNYAQRTPKKMVRLALCSALSDRAAQSRVALVDTWAFEIPKTKDALKALGALGLQGRVLVVLGDDEIVAERSFANIPGIQTVLGAELSAYDVLRNEWIVFSDSTLPGGAPTESENGSTATAKPRASRAKKSATAQGSADDTATATTGEPADATAKATTDDAAAEASGETAGDEGDEEAAR